MAPHSLHIHVEEGSGCVATTTVLTKTVTRTTVRWVYPSSTFRRVVSSQETAPTQELRASLCTGEGTASLDIFHQSKQVHRQDVTLATLPSMTHTQPVPSTTPNLQVPPDSTNPAYPLTLFDRHAVAAPENSIAFNLNSTLYPFFGTMEGGEFQLPDIPVAALITLFVCLGIGFLWSILVWLINTVPKRSDPNTQQVRQDQHNKQSWWKHIWSIQRRMQEKTKPIDKPSKYAPLASNSSAGTLSSNESLGLAATTSANPNQADNTSIRLRKIDSKTTPQRPPSSPTYAPWSTPTLKTSINPEDSPPNPFLPPRVLHPRSSAEYLSAHQAFFAPSNPASPLPAGPLPSRAEPHVSPYASRPPSPVSNLDALEAQHGVELRRSRSTRGVLHIAEGMERTGAKVWARGWLDVVEGGVGRAVDAVVKWTEDGSGEEGLLLPIGNGGGN